MRVRIVIPDNFGTENLEKLKTRLQNMEKEALRFQIKYDNSLIGGFVVYMHSWAYDASLKHRLAVVRQKLASPLASDGVAGE